MLVKIKDEIFNSEIEPIMLILNEEEKENIKSMAPEYSKYCSFPDTGYSEEEIKKFMKI
jgi:hypothetical protein